MPKQKSIYSKLFEYGDSSLKDEAWTSRNVEIDEKVSEMLTEMP